MNKLHKYTTTTLKLWLCIVITSFTVSALLYGSDAWQAVLHLISRGSAPDLEDVVAFFSFGFTFIGLVVMMILLDCTLSVLHGLSSATSIDRHAKNS